MKGHSHVWGSMGEKRANVTGGGLFACRLGEGEESSQPVPCGWPYSQYTGGQKYERGDERIQGRKGQEPPGSQVALSVAWAGEDSHRIVSDDGPTFSIQTGGKTLRSAPARSPLACDGVIRSMPHSFPSLPLLAQVAPLWWHRNGISVTAMGGPSI